jgi:aminopeptidase N
MIPILEPRVSLRSFLPLAALALAACARSIPITPQPDTSVATQGVPVSGGAALAPLARDIHSFARPAEARVTHVALDLVADFAGKALRGSATLDLARSAESREVVLDTRGLDIQAVTSGDGRPLTFAMGTSQPILGAPLTVELPADVRRIVVRYATRPDAGALQWLTPAQTAGKRHPYLFSQGQAILTRTWIPTQDSPGIRQTYSARITVPAELRAVMSAEQLTPEGRAPEGRTNGALRTFEFALRQPIPPYLIALAVGDIAFRPIGARTGVYAEPSVVDSAAREFADVERMVEAAESLYGPYRWGRYDLLVLPPSFPFGGMENPRLTFATPTVLAGDRSLVSLVAHELAHSWSGNLVTNATWSDFWLNEGFTTYFENRIMEALYGADVATMLRGLSQQELQAQVAGFGADTTQSLLYLNLEGKDPDEGMTQVAYDKGAGLLRLLEETVGRARWDAYLRGYFDRNAFQPMTTERWLADLRTHLLRGDASIEQRVGLERWIRGAGIPANFPQPGSDRFAKVEAQARAFAAGTAGAAPASLVTTGWITQEWQHFLGALPDTMTTAQMAALDRQFRFTQSGNSEVLFAWLRKAIAARYEPAMPALERFLTTQGRRKFVRPLYQDLMTSPWGATFARRVYASARPLYHPVTSGSVDAIVK